MASPRSVQAGDAGLPDPVPAHRAKSGTARFAVGAALLTGLLVFFSGRAVWSPETGWFSTSTAAHGSETHRGGSGPSLIESAEARVADASPSTLAHLGNGLARKSLASEDFQRVRPLLGDAEARLIDIYQHIGQGQHREAMRLAETLVADHPNFQLAQLVLGDLLSLQTRPVRQLGDVPDTQALAANEQLGALRDESRRRLRALTERPPEGRIPDQILALAPRSRHAIAIDASRSRLYLFENLAAATDPAGSAPPQLRLIGDFYISVGLSGIEKIVEGDQRTPLGVYYITGNLNPANLPDLYGVGALPINYPNALDLRRGKTGHGIWLHGTPRAQFVRAPQASDGCVVLSNPDLKRLLATVAIRTTPVIIAPELHWVAPESLAQDRTDFDAALQAWREAKSRGELDSLKAMYAEQFRGQGGHADPWWSRMDRELRDKGTRAIELRELSLLRWRDSDDTMVVTFGEALEGQSRSVNKRQYWGRENGHWKIFFEGQAG